MNKLFGISLMLLILCGINTIKAEVYTALAEMEELLETESVLINNLEGYLVVQERKIDYLKLKVQEYQREHQDAVADITLYLSNPINAYLLIKRLTSDWKHLENLMSNDLGSSFLENITNYRNILKFPSDEDLNGAAVGLMRLQDTYKLDTSSVARGELNGIQYSTEMTTSDCFELGRQSYLNGDYYHTALWMNEAMNRLLSEPQFNTYSSITRAEILDYLAFSTYKQGYTVTALRMTNELIELSPYHERAIRNKDFYEKEIAAEDKKILKNPRITKNSRGDDGSKDMKVSKLINKVPIEIVQIPIKTERQKYEMMCRGEIKPTPSQLRPLRCEYVTNNVPFLKIGPLKRELASIDPFIAIYHDVLFDHEIELVKKIAKPRFVRAMVKNAITGESEIASLRISKAAWIKTDENKNIENIVQRVEDMTGLNMETAEHLQVVNYGIGGQYEPHSDFASKTDTNAFKNLGTGNRIATVLFYMSNVEQGGATVFPAIRTGIFPKKGTAVFWYNLYSSGEGDRRTRHASCPVLTGSKWITNKWIHEHGQEFRRQCQLTPDHPEYYEFINY